MTDVDRAASDQPAPRLRELRASAKGWHTIQFALLGFIGLCGVLKGTGTSSGPRWLQTSAGVLILLALIVACYATFLVGRAAWPLYSATRKWPAAAPENGECELQRTGHSLRVGLALTFVALILAAVAATSSWWPEKGASSGALVSVGTTVGVTYCGTLGNEGNGVLVLQPSGQSHAVSLPLSDVTTVTPTSTCG